MCGGAGRRAGVGGDPIPWDKQTGSEHNRVVVWDRFEHLVPTPLNVVRIGGQAGVVPVGRLPGGRLPRRPHFHRQHLRFTSIGRFIVRELLGRVGVDKPTTNCAGCLLGQWGGEGGADGVASGLMGRWQVAADGNV